MRHQAPALRTRASVGRHGHPGAACAPPCALLAHAAAEAPSAKHDRALACALRPQGLTKLLSDNAKGCVREVKFESYFGRKVAIDASMHIYQFMVR